jgi:Protein of unknown function (DUF3034)
MGVRRVVAVFVAILCFSLPAFAEDSGTALFDQGKLLATGGVSAVEGEGGGGLVPWALISGYGTRDGIGINAHATYVGLPDYQLISPGIAVGLFDRVELSYAWQAFDTEATGAALGLGRGFTFHQNIFGAKLKLIGDAVYNQDSWLPQISAGLQHKENDRGAVIAAVGGRGAVGTDFYLAATKLFLAESLLADVTLRETKANQYGILGFGGDKHNAYAPQIEASAAYLISRNFAVGGEFRTKPSNLAIAKEGAAFDVFAAWFLNKDLSVTAAYADLGNIVIHNHQDGVYFSLQAGL